MPARPSRASQLLFLLVVLSLQLSQVESARAQVTGATNQVSSQLEELIKIGEVEVVEFEGNENISDGELGAVVLTRVTSGFSKLLYKVTFKVLGSPAQYVDITTLARDTMTIEEFYKSKGFMTAHASWRLSLAEEGNDKLREIADISRTLPPDKLAELPKPKVKVTFEIDEGPASTISGIAYEGLEVLPEEFQPELTERSLIKRGERYDANAVQDETIRLRALMQENGYPDFRDDSTFVPINTRNNTVRVLLYFSPGHRYRFGNFRVEWDSNAPDDSHVRESLIRKAVTIDSGGWYKESLVEETTLNLLRLNTFENVVVRLDTAMLAGIPEDQRDSMVVPVVIQLRMRSTREAAPGLYAGSGVAGFTSGATLTYTDRNAFGGAESASLQAGWQFTPSTQKRYNLTGDLVLPYFIASKAPLNLNANWLVASQEERYDEVNISARAGSLITLGNPNSRTTLTPDVIAEYVKTTYLDPALVPANVLDKRGRKQVNTIASALFQRDQTNDVFSPSHGWYLGALGETGVPILQSVAPEDFSAASYLKLVPHWKQFFSLQEKSYSVLAYRVRVGAIRLFDPGNSQKDVPLERRFFTGGQTTVRGWGARELLISREENATSDIFLLGGYRLLETNVEWRYSPWRYDPEFSSGFKKLLASLGTALFVDAGQSWDYGIPLRFNQIAIAVGTGLRYDFFVGPLRLDWGLKLWDPNPALNADRHPGTPTTKGLWLWQRKFNHDVFAFQFGIGHAF